MTFSPITIGISLMMISDILIVSMGALAKALGEDISALEVAFYKSALTLIGVSALMIHKSDWSLFKTSHFKAQFFRATIGNVNAILLFWSYMLLPLGVAATFFYAAPIFIVVQSILFLGERAGWVRWSAVLFGFVGIVLITLPGFNEGQANITLFAVSIGLITSIIAASVHISIRYLATLGESAFTTVFYFSLIGTIGIAVPLSYTGLKWPEGLGVLVILLGICALLSQVLKTRAYDFVEASFVAPFRYIGLVWSVVIGYFFWDEIPSLLTVLGAVIIVSANIIIVMRERALKNKALKSTD